ncbi:MAG: anti-sigma factor [Verrucomicrobiota bacterium]
MKTPEPADPESVLDEMLERLQSSDATADDAAKLEALLKADPDLRRRFRARMRMEAHLFSIYGTDQSAPMLTSPETAPADSPAAGSRIIRMRPREMVAWLGAAACLTFAVLMWSTRERNVPPEGTSFARTAPAPVPLTVAQQREQLLASGGDVLHIQFKGGGNAVATRAEGDIVWSSEKQAGYLRLYGLAGNDPSRSQYQLWIVDAGLGTNVFVNGGVFDVKKETGELILPIVVENLIREPVLFAITVERPGGVVNPTGDRVPLVALAP